MRNIKVLKYILSKAWIYKNHGLNTTVSKANARNMVYQCAKNLHHYGYASFYHCFDIDGRYNNTQWKLVGKQEKTIQQAKMNYVKNENKFKPKTIDTPIWV